MCPLIVASLFGRCLVTAAVVKPGQVTKWPLSIALVNVDVVGLKHAACKYWMRSVTSDIWTMLLFWGCKSMVHRPVL